MRGLKPPQKRPRSITALSADLQRLRPPVANQVTGNGTVGQLAAWTGPNTLGDGGVGGGGGGSIAISHDGPWTPASPMAVDATAEGVRGWFALATGTFPRTDTTPDYGIGGELHPALFDWISRGTAGYATSGGALGISFSSTDDVNYTQLNPAYTSVNSVGDNTAIDMGFCFPVPADDYERTLRVYVPLFGVVAQLTATLSDGSVAPATHSVDTGGGSWQTFVFEVVYKASKPGQRLHIVVQNTANYGGGRVGLALVTLA